MTCMSRPLPRPGQSRVLFVLLAALSISCMTRSALPDPIQIEAGFELVRETTAQEAQSIYTQQATERYRPAKVTIVVPRSVIDAEPLLLGGSNLYVARALRIEINPTAVVVQSMAAFLGKQGQIEVVADLASVSPDAELVIEPTVSEFEWRTNMWSYGYFAARVEVRLRLALLDHSTGATETVEPEWVTGGTYWGSSASGMTNRVVRGTAHATARAMRQLGVLSRIPSP